MTSDLDIYRVAQANIRAYDEADAVLVEAMIYR